MLSFIVIFPHFTCYHLFTDSDFMFSLLLRTLITGMVSGSIVAFNIDFNRWHYEHQNRYWSQTDPRNRRQVWSRETPTNQAVLLTIHRARKRSSGLGNNSMVVTLLKIRVSLHVIIWPLRRTCCWTIWTHFLLVFMSYLNTSWCISTTKSSRSVVLGKEEEART